MAINCEFINLIIPISKIDSVYSGGFLKFKDDSEIGFSIGALWHDTFLFRDGAMDSRSLELRKKNGKVWG